MWERVVETHQIGEDAEAIETAAAIVCQAKNSMLRRGGFSPMQWVLGRSLRAPGSLTEEGEADRLQVHEAALDPRSQFSRVQALRTTAQQAFIQEDADAHVRRGMLGRSRPGP